MTSGSNFTEPQGPKQGFSTRRLAGPILALALMGNTQSAESSHLVPPAPEPAEQVAVETLPAVDSVPVRFPAPPETEKPAANSATASASAPHRPASTIVHFPDENWTMTISPGASGSPAQQEYQQVYNSIPYRRTEYLANPGYRHEATLERMFGQMRPTVIQRTDHAQAAVNPRPVFRQPYPVSQSELEQYRLWIYTGLPLPPLLSPIP